MRGRREGESSAVGRIGVGRRDTESTDRRCVRAAASRREQGRGGQPVSGGRGQARPVAGNHRVARPGGHGRASGAARARGMAHEGPCLASGRLLDGLATWPHFGLNCFDAGPPEPANPAEAMSEASIGYCA